ncbi:hypothetical protein U0C82_09650 [Fulvimarina sp. 2208YS6-2-32]|uniref:Uncharacterized protein n=1 Tax=Fulvimarina uroteuthidis TaxID=3098149 RepID=A0ABU5I3L1_9HYPH|nr:hypothetical protein [Fulvimarina sp. 2208YS6-2-32]MDY8109404.1 hypothetical protein [Fulvimarina sp. 2208YS6-2-32]
MQPDRSSACGVGRIVLFETYEQAALGVRDDPGNTVLIVANA